MPSAAYIAPMGWQVLAGLIRSASRGLISAVVPSSMGLNGYIVIACLLRTVAGTAAAGLRQDLLSPFFLAPLTREG